MRTHASGVQLEGDKRCRVFFINFKQISAGLLDSH